MLACTLNTNALNGASSGCGCSLTSSRGDGAGANSRDIFGNPFYPVNTSTGLPFADFGGAWKAGMLAELTQFRTAMPAAILDGHAMDVTDGAVAGLFNAYRAGNVVICNAPVVEGAVMAATEAWGGGWDEPAFAPLLLLGMPSATS